MNSASLTEIAAHIDGVLRTSETPDYASALNGVQVEHRGPVTRIAAAVDCSHRTIQGAVASGANLLLVHHGLFWGGLRPLTGVLYARVCVLLDHDVALYSSHLPLDSHERFGNSLLLARELGLEPAGGFARYQTIHCGVTGESDVPTEDLVRRLHAFSASHGGRTLATPIAMNRRTRRWAICSGAGADARTLDEAIDLGIDTLITGEGPHWTAVEAEERRLVIAYAGHYATEILGVRALAEHVAATFDLPWTWVTAPTGT